MTDEQSTLNILIWAAILVCLVPMIFYARFNNKRHATYHYWVLDALDETPDVWVDATDIFDRVEAKHPEVNQAILNRSLYRMFRHGILERTGSDETPRTNLYREVPMEAR